jgi:hypothetical protein
MSATPYGVARMHPSETYAFPPMHHKEKRIEFFLYMGAILSHPPYFRKRGFKSFSKIEGIFGVMGYKPSSLCTKNKVGNYSTSRARNVNEFHVSCFRINVSNLLVPRACL